MSTEPQTASRWDGLAARDGLSSALNPESIAIIGASDDPHKIGGRPLLYLSRFGYEGRIYPVNPNRAMAQGRATYPSISSLPETPDLAVIATPGAQVPTAVDECARRGVRTAIVMASGFGETTDAAAIAAQHALVARARGAGMRIVGPNSQGLANFGSGAVASFSTMFLEVEPADGPVGIISQSGMMSVVPYGILRRRGIGVRHAHATGNDADVSLSEMALAVVQDPGVRLLLLYIESISDAATLARAAAVARERDVPIVAVKAGRTARGQAAARSHTGALANEDRIVDAFFREHGIWRAKDVDELVSAAELYLEGWRPAGKRLAVLSNSGASCVMAADAAQEQQLELAALSESTVRSLASQLPSYATTTNPVDITAALLTNSGLFGGMLRVLAGDPGIDVLLVALPVAGVGYDVPAFAAAGAEFIARAGKPLVLCTPQPGVARLFREVGVPTFESQTQAVAAVAQLVGHSSLLRRARGPSVAPAGAVFGPAVFLDEAASLALMRDAGLPIVAHRVCTSESETLAAYGDLGPRVVMKACAPELLHKSDDGLVLLDIDSEAGVRAAFATLRRALDGRGLAHARVVVATMAGGRHEFMLGARRDPVFGPVVTVGDGGRYVEVFRDLAICLAPVTADRVREALASLRVAPLLGGVRGEPALDVDALCAAAVQLGDAIASDASIRSIDLNPVIVRARGQGVIVVDALVERCGTTALRDGAPHP
jgi:acyl-CoA synthetase (NDP forming)